MSAPDLDCRPRIAVDTSPLADPRGSLARWMEPALEALTAHGGVECVPFESSRTRCPRVRLLRGAQRRLVQSCQGLHSFTSGFPLRIPDRVPLVQTVHELPWRHGVAEGSGPLHRGWVAAGRRRAIAVVCPTEHVRGDLLAARRGRSTGPPIRVLSWGLDPAFRRPSPTGRPADRALLLPLADRPKKRALCAVRALPHLPSDLQLQLTGHRRQAPSELLSAARDLGVADRVEWLGRVDGSALPDRFARAAGVLCLAASEGFCLPVAEALASGVPPIYPRAGAQAEVAGGHGYACDDPTDPRALAGAIERALTWSAADADAARAFSVRYAWSAWAEGAVRLWRELVADR
ncbi:MAG: glycosyltransferase family 4 protein [Planctomycetota bacterium]